MTNNEKIAQWLGYEILNPEIAETKQSMMVKHPYMPEWVPDYDKHLSLWQGGEGLFGEIMKNKRFYSRFIKELLARYGLPDVIQKEDGSEWMDTASLRVLINALPGQLARALVHAIEDEQSLDGIEEDKSDIELLEITINQLKEEVARLRNELAALPVCPPYNNLWNIPYPPPFIYNDYNTGTKPISMEHHTEC